MLELLPDEKYLKAITNAISKAEKCIDIMAFKVEMTHSKRGRKLLDFWAILINKAHQGVKVRMITNQKGNGSHIPNSNLYAMNELKKNGVEVRTLPGTRICHAKVIVIDNFKTFVGSHNLSVRSCANNLEASVMTDDTILTSWLNEFYNKAWDRATKI